MPIDILERYKLIFAEHHYASDFRVKIVTGWCLMYAGLAAAFVWVHSTSKSLDWIVTAAGVIITVLMWVADHRNRAALRAAKDTGFAIEQDQDADIPTEQRFFARLETESRVEKYVTHSRAIDALSIVMVISLGFATWYLLSYAGVLPE